MRSVFLILAISAFGASAVYNETISEILSKQAPTFLDNSTGSLRDALSTTSECPCNVFQEYALSLVPNFTNETVTCFAIPNATEKDDCLRTNVCEPYRVLSDNACGGLFNASVPESLRTLLNGLITLCDSINVTITINNTCTADQVEDWTVFAVNATPSQPVLEYHIIRRSFSLAQLPANQTTYVASYYTPADGNAQILAVHTKGENGIIDVSVTSDFASGAVQNVTSTVTGSNGNVHFLTGALNLPQSVTETIANIEELASLNATITALSLGTALNGLGNVTLLAPNDNAFTAYPLLAKLSNGSQTDLLTSHVIADTILSNQLVNGAQVETLSRKLNLSVALADNMVKFVATFNNLDYTVVQRADVVTSNGVIHICDYVLRQEDQPTYNVVDNLLLDSRVANWAARLEANASTFLDYVTSLEKATVFAPLSPEPMAYFEDPLFNASAFYALLDIKVNAGDLQQGANVVPSQLADPSLVRLHGQFQKLVVNAGTDGVFVQWGFPSEQVQVRFADIEGSNGVMHITNGDIMVPQLTTETVQRGNYSELYQRLTNNTVFSDEINGLDVDESNFTFFIAANKYWSGLSSEFNATEQILRNQMIKGLVLYSTDIMQRFPTVVNGTSSFNVTMDGNSTFLVQNRTDGIYIGGLKVLQVNIPTSNGVIHVLDGVLGNSGSSSSSLSAGALAAIIVGGVAFLGLLCYCFFMQKEGSPDEYQPFASNK